MTRRGDEGELLRRCDELTRGLDEVCADRIEPVEGGFAVLTPSLPLVWALNYVIFDQPGLEAERMAEICNEAMGGAGLEHRTVMTTDPGEDERVAPGFRRIGWEVDTDVFMVLRSEADRPGDAEVREVEHPVELRRALMGEDDSLRRQNERPDEVIEQLLEMERRLSAADSDRWFIAEADGRPASTARMLTRGGLGLLDDVGTLRAARNRGLARATVQAAVSSSREDGNEHTFLITDAEDWPQQLYEKLGFAPIGIFRGFRLRGY